MSDNNYIELIGTITKDLTSSRKQFDEQFYFSEISVCRTNKDVKDIIPIMITEKNINGINIKKGARVFICGEFRSYNDFVDGKAKLKLFVFVKEIAHACSDDDCNNAYVYGHICKAVTFRSTPLHKEISDIMLAINRPYGKSDYIPCIAWNENARYISAANVGDAVEINGRIQSREYTKNDTKMIAYELSAKEIRILQ